MGKNENNSGVMSKGTSGMLWFDILTRVLMPIQAIICFILGAVCLVFASFSIQDVLIKMLEKNSMWADWGDKLYEAGLAPEKFKELSEVSEFGIFIFAICLFFVATGVFTFASRSSLMYFEKKALKIFLALYIAMAGIFLFMAFCLWVYEFYLPLILVCLIISAAILAWGIVNFIYLKKKSYQFTI